MFFGGGASPLLVVGVIRAVSVRQQWCRGKSWTPRPSRLPCRSRSRSSLCSRTKKVFQREQHIASVVFSSAIVYSYLSVLYGKNGLENGAYPFNIAENAENRWFSTSEKQWITSFFGGRGDKLLFFTENMLDGIKWMMEYHSWSWPSHHYSDPFLHVWSITMDGALLTGGLFLTETASVKSAMGIFQKFPAAWA